MAELWKLNNYDYSILRTGGQAIFKSDRLLVGFGTFKPAKRVARLGKNPKTGETLKIAATTVPKFTAGATFKAAVAGKKATAKKAPAKAPAKPAAKKPVAKKK
jgi:DNA-binding protein HU-beta